LRRRRRTTRDLTGPLSAPATATARNDPVRTARAIGLWLAPCCLWLANCVAPLDAPSAFSAAPFLCDPGRAADFAAFVEPCRQEHLRDQSCAGVMSFKGVVDSQPIVVDAEVVKAVYMDRPLDDGTVSRTVTLRGFSPYFAFLIDLIDFLAPPGVSRSGPVANTACGSVVGGSCSSTELFNLEARGGNYLSALVNEVRDIRLQTADELRVGLTADLRRGGNLEVCFDVFPPSSAP
jgi:hypothetical protein